MVAHTCNSSTLETEAGRSEFEASLGYAARLCLKIKSFKAQESGGDRWLSG